GRADDHADGEVDDVAAHRELLELTHHAHRVLPGCGRWRPLAYTRRRDPAAQDDGVVQSRFALVARREGGDAGRGAHEHQVAGAQGVELRQLVQDVGDVPDQVRE